MKTGMIYDSISGMYFEVETFIKKTPFGKRYEPDWDKFDAFYIKKFGKKKYFLSIPLDINYKELVSKRKEGKFISLIENKVVNDMSRLLEKKEGGGL